jgi:hypothetical protein
VILMEAQKTRMMTRMQTMKLQKERRTLLGIGTQTTCVTFWQTTYIHFVHIVRF